MTERPSGSGEAEHEDFIKRVIGMDPHDSRFGLGFVPLDPVVGTAFAILRPPSRTGWIHSS